MPEAGPPLNLRGNFPPSIQAKQAAWEQSLDVRKLEIPTTTNNTLSSIPLLRQRLQRASKSSRSPYLNVPTAAAHFPSFEPLAGTPPELAISVPLHLHVYTPATHLQSSRAPCLYASYTSLHRRQSSRNPYLLDATRLQRSS